MHNVMVLIYLVLFIRPVPHNNNGIAQCYLDHYKDYDYNNTESQLFILFYIETIIKLWITVFLFH